LVPAIDERFRKRIRDIDLRLHDNGTAEIFIFHGEFPSKDDVVALTASTSRHLKLVHADSLLAEFPKEFDPYLEEPNWRRRSKWGYQQVKTDTETLICSLKMGCSA
jgi:hypothetical protein